MFLLRYAPKVFMVFLISPNISTVEVIVVVVVVVVVVIIIIINVLDAQYHIISLQSMWWRTCHQLQ